MSITTQTFIRKPLYVEAVKVTAENFLEITFWCKGSIKNNDGSDTKHGDSIDPRRQHIEVRVHNPKNARQTKAMVGDWILYTERGYKVYTNKAFQASFDLVDEFPKESEEQLSEDSEESQASEEVEAA